MLQEDHLDIVLSNGMVVDPAQGLEEITEVGIRGRRIAAVGSRLPRSNKTRVVDCRGLIVTPGLIDLHVHVSPGIAQLSIDPERVMLEGGVTTMLDTGSAGSATWPALQDQMTRTRAHVLALIHICATGLGASHIGELLSPHLSDPQGAVDVIRAHPTRAVGVKIRAGEHIIGAGEQGWKHLREAVWAARESGTFLMVHIGSTPMSLVELVGALQPGDMITHCYKGGSYGHRVLDENGRLFPQLLEAERAGIIYDVGHGQGSFDWDVAERAIDQGLLPTTISTDLHRGCIGGPVYDLPLTMTKMTLLGLSLKDVVERTTWAPAKGLGLSAEIGTLQPGSTADVTLLAWKEGDWALVDSYGKTRRTDRALRAVGVVRDGEIVRGWQ